MFWRTAEAKSCWALALVAVTLEDLIMRSLALTRIDASKIWDSSHKINQVYCQVEPMQAVSDPALKPCNRRSSQQVHLEQKPKQELAVEVPEFFLCPIHLEIMADPVTLSTGMTHDWMSIKRWLATGHNTCPTSNQVLQSKDLIPNRTLSRVIQNWCTENKASEIDCLPTLRPQVEPDTTKTLLHGLST
uniref:RING-type E3 ubiquitin transferase n=1 Tax=Physcomitrium patens TaxID=3218 RepID=A0A2K1K5Y5_PHYPA|nr:hypothetical protein PHYPA_011089 [Physcomitrium patens]